VVHAKDADIAWGSLDEASRPELAVIKRFALATSLRIEEIVTLSSPQLRLADRNRRPDG
jgi:hypothetical protein